MTTSLNVEFAATSRENYVHILPDDALKEIFEWLIPSHLHTDAEGLDSLVPSWPAWVLSSVCARWRAVSLSHPRLWAVIKLNLSKPNSEGALEYAIMDRLQLQLRRSGTHDLFICLWMSLRASKEDYLSLLRLLKTTGGRWKKLDISLPLDAYSALSVTSFPALTHLFITTSSDGETHIVIDTFRSSPQLVDVRHHNYQDDICSIDLDLPWSQIELYLSRNGFMSNLGQLSQIQYLELQNCSLSNALASSLLNSFSASNPMVFPSLIFLYLWTIHPDDVFFVGKFLGCLSAPILVMLSITITDNPMYEFPRLRDYHPILTILHIGIHDRYSDDGARRRDTLDPDILAFLRSTPTVKTLHLEQNAISSRVLTGLCFDRTTDQLPLPLLISFGMSARKLEGVFEDVIDLIESRSSNSSFCSALQEVWFTKKKNFERQRDVVTLAERFKWLDVRVEEEAELLTDVASIVVG